MNILNCLLSVHEGHTVEFHIIHSTDTMGLFLVLFVFS